MKLFEQVRSKKVHLRRNLLAWFRRNAREFPWRRTRDPYRIWLSEVLLQQTRIEAALPYYERFIKAFPTVRDLAAAPEDRVLKLWEGLGYYSRARNLQKAAKIIVNENGGRFPTEASGWQRLPGVGRYTAGAVASIALGERVAILDGNVKRVLARLFAIEKPIDASRTQELMWSVAEMLVPPKTPGDFNQALMELGARICKPAVPQCPRCPVRNQCEARARGWQRRLPRRRARKPVPHYQVVAAVLQRKGRYLLGKRPPEGLLGGLWELPGGKVEPGETNEEALAREIREELGVAIKVGSLVTSVDHAYSHFRITLHAYRCVLERGRPQSRYYSEVKWVRRAELDQYAFPGATRKILPFL